MELLQIWNMEKVGGVIDIVELLWAEPIYRYRSSTSVINIYILSTNRDKVEFVIYTQEYVASYALHAMLYR